MKDLRQYPIHRNNFNATTASTATNKAIFHLIKGLALISQWDKMISQGGTTDDITAAYNFALRRLKQHIDESNKILDKCCNMGYVKPDTVQLATLIQEAIKATQDL